MNELSMAGKPCPNCASKLPANLYEVAGIAICLECDATLHWIDGALAVMSDAELDQLDREVKRTIENAAVGVLIGMDLSRGDDFTVEAWLDEDGNVIDARTIPSKH